MESGVKKDIALYPEFSELTMDLRPILHPIFKSLKAGISEFSFAGIYLFRDTYGYKVSKIKDDIFVITGTDNSGPFFMLPFGLPDGAMLDELFQKFSSMKAASEEQARALSSKAYSVTEDRDNFDYLYLREEMVNLTGRKFHKKKNLVRFFAGSYTYEGRPLLTEYLKDAGEVLELWSQDRGDEGDFRAAKEALELTEELQLCGAIYYVEGKPAAYTLGEELAGAESFVVHFEKGLEKYKGLMQFVNRSFASILPDKYLFINREQDLGHEGLRQAKMSYRPFGFVKKYRVRRNENNPFKGSPQAV